MLEKHVKAAGEYDSQVLGAVCPKIERYLEQQLVIADSAARVSALQAVCEFAEELRWQGHSLKVRTCSSLSPFLSRSFLFSLSLRW